MKKILILALIIFSSQINSAFTELKTDTIKESLSKTDLNNTYYGSIGHFIDIDGKKNLMYTYSATAKGDADNLYNSNYLITTDKLHYYTKDGEYIKLKHSKIFELFVGGNYYSRLKIGSVFGLNRLHKIIMTSDKYILTEYFSHGAFYYYIFDIANQKFEHKKVRSVVKSKKDRKLAEKYILPYFKECEKFSSRIKKNLSKDYKQLVGPLVQYYSRMTAGISNMHCK